MDIKPEDLYLLEDKVLVDIRSPSEYEEFHIPGAINLPLFEDEEKRLIGVLYRGEGLEKAKELGYEIAWKKFEHLLEKFKELKERHRHVVLYCWRGGLRSQELCRVLRSVGLEVLRLEGGYRAYREFILKDMESLIENKRFLVLTGKTGVGKTKLLRKLREEGYPVIDLEGLARDRGSVFGKLGMGKGISQKLFDALLYEELRKLEGNLLLVEDESRLIGRVHLPWVFWQKKEEGMFLEVEANYESRLKNLIEDYASFDGWQEEFRKSLLKIRKYLGEESYRKILHLLEENRAEELALLLMTEYYDRTYKLQKKPLFRLDCSDFEACLESLKELYARLLKEREVPELCR
ncbi:MAG: tRNA 2-selenouridine(34) synthase MnmH [Aquificaceae bacterium]|nr:tRNA 2-selenouridine(34) synthase MnmH [Aquificaceae bacterium]MDW8032089.1 tRNA 2-selenouridine(34) synthase MnmH [Aquificaceae bacterium]MDW8294410.1 tRNA 2-selenouridine(34) synthase MnmH [Aquificaceae bacterium]